MFLFRSLLAGLLDGEANNQKFTKPLDSTKKQNPDIVCRLVSLNHSFRTAGSSPKPRGEERLRDEGLRPEGAIFHRVRAGKRLPYQYLDPFCCTCAKIHQANLEGDILILHQSVACSTLGSPSGADNV